MKFHSVFRPVLSLASLLLMAGPAQAVQDTNGNTLSDVWEKYYNGGSLFDAGNPAHAITADPDGDGWTNEKEAIAGTNPFATALPQGVVRSDIVRHPDAEGLFMLTWPSTQGKAYKLAMSADLVSWADFGELIPGTGQPIELAVDAMHQDGTTPERFFWRVKIEDDNPDGDTLTTWEELALGLNPYSPDTDLDGIFDGVDAQPLVSATLADPDGSNPPVGSATNLRGFWDFETVQGSGSPVLFTDRSGANRHATSTSGGPQPLGMPSQAGRIGPGYITPPISTTSGITIYSVSGWLKFGKDTIKKGSCSWG